MNVSQNRIPQRPSRERSENHAKAIPLPALYGAFLLSGFAALIYEVVWQRALFTLYGVNIESVTIVVTTFMLGLGLGSLAGGQLSRDSRRNLLRIFGIMELGIGGFGIVSLDLFRWLGGLTAGGSPGKTLAITFALLLIPTVLMGGTLPLLVAQAVKRLHNVGRSVAMLYFANTFGSALAALAASIWFLGRFGQHATVLLATGLNALVGGSILLASRPKAGS